MCVGGKKEKKADLNNYAMWMRSDLLNKER